MAFFNFRWPGAKEQGDTAKPAKRSSRSAQAESIDEMRRRARHRLIGAAVLVLIGIIGFPLLFDTQPRPIPVDIPIDIPDRNKVAPLVVPGTPVAQAPAASAPVPPKPTSALPIPVPLPPSAGLGAGEEVVPPKPAVTASKPTPAEAKPATKPEVAHPTTKPVPAPATPEPKPAPTRTDDAARARALLEGRGAETHAAAAKPDDTRYIVQVGAFAEAEKAREVRAKLERAGLKTYAQVVDTKDGKRTRVRVGPFTNRAEADKAAARIKGLDLSASILTL